MQGGMRDELREGWSSIMASAAGVGVGLTGLPFYSFGVFIKPLGAAFGWSRGEITLGMTCLSMGSILACPILGLVIDRWGVRRIAIPSLIGLAIGFLLLSRCGSHLGAFYGAWLVLALLGAGTTPLTWTRPIGMIFEKARGLALGLTLLGTGIAAIAGPPALNALIGAQGWRTAYLAIAAFVLIIVLPLVVLFLREGPHSARGVDAAGLPGLTRGEALRTGNFWRLGAGIFLIIVGQSAATVHLVPLLTDGGIPAGRAAALAGLLGIAVIVGRIVIGLSLDRFDPPLVARTVLMLPAAALALLLLGHGEGVATLAVLLLGIAAGAETDLLAYFVGRYFGMRAYGAIYGMLLSIFAIGAAIGAPLAGWSYDHQHSYVVALVSGILVFIVGALCVGSVGGHAFAPRSHPQPA